MVILNFILVQQKNKQKWYKVTELYCKKEDRGKRRNNKHKKMINKTNIMHFQALLLQIVAVINTYTSGLEQYKYTK